MSLGPPAVFEVQKLETCISVIKTRKSLGSFKYLNLSESLNHNIRSQLVSNYLPTYKRSATLGTLFSTSASFNRMRQSTAFVVCILYFVLKVWYILKYIWGSLKSLHTSTTSGSAVCDNSRRNGEWLCA